MTNQVDTLLDRAKDVPCLRQPEFRVHDRKDPMRHARSGFGERDVVILEHPRQVEVQHMPGFTSRTAFPQMEFSLNGHEADSDSAFGR